MFYTSGIAAVQLASMRMLFQFPRLIVLETEMRISVIIYPSELDCDGWHKPGHDRIHHRSGLIFGEGGMFYESVLGLPFDV